MIEAKVIKDSISQGSRVTTLQLKMPRFILSQFNKHRAFESSAASSRAIPVAKMIEQVEQNPVIPVYWGANQAGMVADSELSDMDKDKAEWIWLAGRDAAVEVAKEFQAMGLHKQLANRVLEPYMWSDVVVTATDWDNFFNLRLAHDSQPEMQELARKMKKVMDDSEPVERVYHLPYITEVEAVEYVYVDASMLSAARCARVSYLNHDQSEPNVDKDFELAHKLKEAKHMTPFGHQLTAAEPTKRFANFQGWYSRRYEFEHWNK